MSAPVHPAASPPHPVATQHLPGFITAPGDTDVLMIVTGGILLACILMFGLIFFRLHTLPERIAHKGHKLQFEIVAVLGLLALVTHIHIFWVAGLLLALIDIPDFGGFLSRIAGSTEKIAGINTAETTDDANVDPHAQPASAQRPQPIDGERAPVTDIATFAKPDHATVHARS